MAAMPGQGLIQVATKCKLFFALPEWFMDWPLSIHHVFGYASSSFPRTQRIRVVPYEAGMVKKFGVCPGSYYQISFFPILFAYWIGSLRGA